MTTDVIALCRVRPDLETEIGALFAAGPDLLLRTGHRFPLLELLDDKERLVLAVDGPRLIQVPGEVRRLLGVPLADIAEPVWWIEVRASASRADEPEAAVSAARRLAQHLVGQYGGVVWPTVA